MKIFTVKRPNTVCWLCKSPLLMLKGCDVCPHCGAHNPEEYIDVRPAEYRLVVIRYLLGGHEFREEFRDTSVEEATASLQEGATVERVIPLWQTAPERHADYRTSAEWFEVGYECPVCGCHDAWPGAFPECICCGNI